MERKSLRIYIFEILVIVFLLLACVFDKFFTRPLVAITLLVCMGISCYLLKHNKIKSLRTKQIVILMSVFGIIFIAIKYILGVFLGFYTSTVKFSSWSILNYILPYIVIIVSTEIMRKKVILTSSKKDKLSRILYLIIMVLLDIYLLSNIHSLNSLKEWFEFVAIVLFPSIANNLLYNFIDGNFREEVSIIIYRILTTMYIYFIPITPDLEVLLDSLIGIVVPVLIFAVLSVYLPKKQEFSLTKDRIEKILVTILLVFVTLIVALVSCKFKYCAIVIGSGSMTGTINKGDVIIYEAYSDKDKKEGKAKLNVGDILIFNQDGRKIVHRVIDKRVVKGEEVCYTKGDANQQRDDGYVTEENVVGVYKMRVPYIGQITLGINGLFE